MLDVPWSHAGIVALLHSPLLLALRKMGLSGWDGRGSARTQARFVPIHEGFFGPQSKSWPHPSPIHVEIPTLIDYIVRLARVAKIIIGWAKRQSHGVGDKSVTINEKGYAVLGHY